MPGSGAIAWMSVDGAAVVGGPGGTLARGATVGIGAAVAMGAAGATDAGAGTAVACGAGAAETSTGWVVGSVSEPSDGTAVGAAAGAIVAGSKDGTLGAAGCAGTVSAAAVITPTSRATRSAINTNADRPSEGATEAVLLVIHVT